MQIHLRDHFFSRLMKIILFTYKYRYTCTQEYLSTWVNESNESWRIFFSMMKYAHLILLDCRIILSLPFSLAISNPLYRSPVKDSERFWRNCHCWPKSICLHDAHNVPPPSPSPPNPPVCLGFELYRRFPSFTIALTIGSQNSWYFCTCAFAIFLEKICERGYTFASLSSSLLEYIV